MNVNFRILPIALCFLTTTLSACMPATKSVKYSAVKPTSSPVNDTAQQSRAAPAMTEQEQSAVAALQWLNNANAAQDAANEIQQASAEGRQPALIAFARRGLQYPGLTPAQLAGLKGNVSYNIAQGSGDVIYGETHRQMLVKLSAYATAFNQAIAAAIQ